MASISRTNYHAAALWVANLPPRVALSLLRTETRCGTATVIAPADFRNNDLRTLRARTISLGKAKVRPRRALERPAEAQSPRRRPGSASTRCWARFLPGVPRTRIFRLIRKGEVRVNGKRARPETARQAGDRVRVPPVHERSVSAEAKIPAAWRACRPR